jgi:hypothetical protein
MDESNDITDTAQLLIFIRGIDDTFMFHEELSGLCSLKGTITGEDLFLKVQETVASLELSLEKLKSVTTDGGKDMWFLDQCSRANLQGSDASWL